MLSDAEKKKTTTMDLKATKQLQASWMVKIWQQKQKKER